jgi:ABC-type Na+ transport system ATPase subunit NatA
MLHLVEELCRRVVIIHRGRKVLDGSLEEIRGTLPESAGLEEIFLQATEDESAP